MRSDRPHARQYDLPAKCDARAHTERASPNIDGFYGGPWRGDVRVAGGGTVIEHSMSARSGREVALEPASSH